MMTIRPYNLSNKLGVPVEDIRSILPTNKLYTWEQQAGVRTASQINTIVVHHDAWPKKNRAGKSDIEFAKEIAIDHINSKKNIPGGDPGFPYTMWIRNGVLYLCNDPLTRTYGVSSNNGYTVHISVSGDYENYDMLDERDRKALYAGILLLKEWIPSIIHIKGHKELNPSSCPGRNIHCDQIRKEVISLEEVADYQETENSVISEIVAAKARIDDLYKKAIQPGTYQREAIRKLSIINPFLKEQGFI